jgi:tRNA(adenine34) deaminase
MTRITTTDAAAMHLALAEAVKAGAAGDIPIGAIVLDPQGVVLAAAGNARERAVDPTAHAEILALRSAAAVLGDWRLAGCTLVVTLEPCPMCAGAVVMSRVARLVFGAWNDEYGAAGSAWDLVRDRRLNHRPEVVGGVLEQECGRLVQDYMGLRRTGVRR